MFVLSMAQVDDGISVALDVFVETGWALVV